MARVYKSVTAKPTENKRGKGPKEKKGQTGGNTTSENTGRETEEGEGE